MKLLYAINFLLVASNTTNIAFGKRIGGGSKLSNKPLDGSEESGLQDQEMDLQELQVKRTSVSDDYYDDDDDEADDDHDDENEYYKYHGKGCRNKHGDKGSKHHDFDLYFHKSRHFCESKCNNLGHKCYGYEYAFHDEKCEIWRVLIYDVEYVKGLDCYVKN